jgi:hypothetical protein
MMIFPDWEVVCLVRFVSSSKSEMSASTIWAAGSHEVDFRRCNEFADEFSDRKLPSPGNWRKTDNSALHEVIGVEVEVARSDNLAKTLFLHLIICWSVGLEWAPGGRSFQDPRLHSEGATFFDGLRSPSSTSHT